MAHSYPVHTDSQVPLSSPVIRRVALGAPFAWLRDGTATFLSAPLVSLGYGVAFTLLALGLSSVAVVQPQFIFTLMAGLLAVGPFLAGGLYLIAKRQGGPHSRAKSRSTVTFHKGRVAVFVAAMLLLTVAWVRLSGLVFAVYFDQLAPGMALSVSAVNGSFNPALLGVLGVSSTLFALLVFAASALSLPMIVDGKAEAIPALVASLKAVVQQPATMLLWAGLIVTLTLVGVATIIGLAFVFPVLAYATWHCYQAMVK